MLISNYWLMINNLFSIQSLLFKCMLIGHFEKPITLLLIGECKCKILFEIRQPFHEKNKKKFTFPSQLGAYC